MSAKKSGGSGSKGPAVDRSSKTGRFVTDKYAKTHPSTTEKQHPKKGK